jgi:hypothetical protein
MAASSVARASQDGTRARRPDREVRPATDAVRARTSSNEATEAIDLIG